MKEYGKSEKTALIDVEPTLFPESPGEREKLSIPRFFTEAGVHPYDALVWESRSASITNDKGEIIF